MPVYHADSRLVDPPEFDVLLTDPPYSAHCHSSAVSCGPGGAVERDFGFDPMTADLRETVAQYAASAKRWGVVFQDLESAEDYARAAVAAGATRIRHLPWIRWSMPQLSADRPPSGAELITLTYGTTKGKKRWTGPGWLTHVAHTCLRGKDKHPTEKPLDLALDLVSWFSEPGELILDPFAGAGTFGLAAKLLGRRYVGYDTDLHWVQAANDRLTRHLSDRDAEGLHHWTEACHETLDKCLGILQAEANKPRPAVKQVIRVVEAVERDLRYVQ